MDKLVDMLLEIKNYGYGSTYYNNNTSVIPRAFVTGTPGQLHGWRPAAVLRSAQVLGCRVRSHGASFSHRGRNGHWPAHRQVRVGCLGLATSTNPCPNMSYLPK